MSAELTPNVVVSNPKVRRVATWVIGVAAILFPVLQLIQTETALDFSAWLPAAIAVTSFLAGVFGITVVRPNIPTVKGEDAMPDTEGDDEPSEIPGSDSIDAERADELGLGKHGRIE